jgi:hypothetical protein
MMPQSPHAQLAAHTQLQLLADAAQGSLLGTVLGEARVALCQAAVHLQLADK